MSAFDTVRSLTTIKKGASAASLTLSQRADGSYVFTGGSGNEVVVRQLEAQVAFKELFDAIDALA